MTIQKSKTIKTYIKGILALLLFWTASAFAQEFSDNTLIPESMYGPHKVGFAVHYLQDKGRTFQTDAHDEASKDQAFEHRPIQMGIWFPARSPHPESVWNMTDIYALELQEMGPKNVSTQEVKAHSQSIIDYYVSRNREGKQVDLTKINNALNYVTKALKRAQIIDGKFPIIIYATSINSSLHENMVLNTLLASHGFIVAATPSVGSNGPRMDRGAKGIMTQWSDHIFTLNSLVQLYPQADTTNIGAIGYSRGGNSASVFAMNNAMVKAFVSLDGSEARNMMIPALQEVPTFEPAQMKAAYVHFFSKPHPSFPENLFLAQQLTGNDILLVDMKTSEHQDYGSSFVMADSLSQTGTKARNADEVVAIYATMSKYTLAAMNAYLKGNEQAKTWLAGSVQGNQLDEILIGLRRTAQ